MNADLRDFRGSDWRQGAADEFGFGAEVEEQADLVTGGFEVIE
jgi:hypothetical protein